MKTNGTLIRKQIHCILFLSALQVNALAQADFSFINHSLVSGTARQAGSMYHFPNVRTGIDCYVSILYISPGTSVETFDDNTPGTGFIEAFQPRIRANSYTSGYAEFHFRFVKEGTNTDTVITEIAATSIDVDGNHSGTDSLLEFDEYMLPSAFHVDFDMQAGQMAFDFKSSSIVGRHSGAVDYAGIDTTARAVMFTVIYPHASTFTVRIGVNNNKSGNTTRQRSVYFKRFDYPNSFLPVNELRSFTGVANDDNVRLDWSMIKGHSILSAEIEKSSNGIAFSRIGSASMAGLAAFAYTDNTAPGNYYYRLKLTDAQGRIFYSQLLLIKNGQSTPGSFRVFPTVANSYTTVNFNSSVAGAAVVLVADNSGRVVLKQPVNVQPGVNSMLVNGLHKMRGGNYVVVLQGTGFRHTQKIVITK